MSTKKTLFVFAPAWAACNVVDDGAEDSFKKGKLLADVKNWIPADEILVALRRAYSLTYSTKTTEDSPQARLVEIRSTAAAALQAFSDCLKSLRLRPVGANPEDLDKVKVFKYLLLPCSDLKHKVLDEESGRKMRLGELMDLTPADAAIRGLRQILSIAFEEAFSDKEFIRLLAQIRKQAAETVAPYNAILEIIEVEPVAIPTVFGDEKLTEGNDGGLETAINNLSQPNE